ncbi:MAG: S8 family peptidase [Dehalococcoidia bacterium]|nr:MAG: S8 family peptidase [Dehalococcoidia bacterium]
MKVSIIVMLTLVLALESACYDFAEPPTHVEMAGISTQVTDEILPWGVERVGAELVHSQNKGQGVKVAILDTGIDLDHPDLWVAGNVSFVEGTVNGDDDNGHGTMVAGIVAALDNGIGVVGIAPEVELYAVKVLDSEGVGTSCAIRKGIEWAIDNDMQVMNMSFGCISKLPQEVRVALKKAYQAGIVLVAAAGNEGTASDEEDNIWAPARYRQVIAVGAIDELDNCYSSSSSGDTLELVAPGVNIYSTLMGGGYADLTATSASSPHVVGVAALLIASGVTSNDEVRQILQSTAEDFEPSGWDSWYGYGLVNAAEAVAAVLRGMMDHHHRLMPLSPRPWERPDHP